MIKGFNNLNIDYEDKDYSDVLDKLYKCLFESKVLNRKVYIKDITNNTLFLYVSHPGLSIYVKAMQDKLIEISKDYEVNKVVVKVDYNFKISDDLNIKMDGSNIASLDKEEVDKIKDRDLRIAFRSLQS